MVKKSSSLNELLFAERWASRIGEIIYGTADLKRGFRTVSKNLLHPSTKLKGPVLENECSQILKSFFSAKR